MSEDPKTRAGDPETPVADTTTTAGTATTTATATATTTAPPPRRRPGGALGLMLAFTRGLVFDQHLRRVTMFYVALAAILMAFGADYLLSGWAACVSRLMDGNNKGGWYSTLQRADVMRFCVYWLACAWLTILAALLAIYDMLMVRVQARLTRRHLRTHILGEEGGGEAAAAADHQQRPHDQDDEHRPAE